MFYSICLKPMSEIITHYVIVLLLNGTTVKCKSFPFCWGPPGISSRNPGGPLALLQDFIRTKIGLEQKEKIQMLLLSRKTSNMPQHTSALCVCLCVCVSWVRVCVLYWRILCLHRPVGVCGEQRQAHSAPGLVLSLNPMHSTHSLSHTHTDTYAHTHTHTHTHTFTHTYTGTLKRGRPGKPGRFN